MNAKEQRLYRLELKLIKEHFKGLRPRPVKLVKKLELGANGEATEPNLLIKDRKRTRQELETLLKHELIHYELKDKGKAYHGHGEAFLKRAQELGIVNSYVLQRCFSAEEYEHTPTIRKTKKVPLPRFQRQLDEWFEELFAQCSEPFYFCRGVTKSCSRYLKMLSQRWERLKGVFPGPIIVLLLLVVAKFIYFTRSVDASRRLKFRACINQSLVSGS